MLYRDCRLFRGIACGGAISSKCGEYVVPRSRTKVAVRPTAEVTP